MADKDISINVTANDEASSPLLQILRNLGEFSKGVYEGAKAELQAIEADRAYAASLEKTKTPVQELEGRLKQLAVQFLAVKEVVAQFVDSVKEADKLDDLSDKTGKTASNLKELGYAAKIGGSSLDGLITAFDKLGRSAVASEEDMKKQAQAFSDVGVSATDVNGKIKDSETLFNELADAFANIEDGPEKSAAAFRIFGSEAKNLLPLLNRGAAGIKALKDEARELGRQSPEDFDKFAKASGDLFDNLDRLKLVFSGLFNELNSELVPVLNIFLDQIISSAKEGGILKDVMDGLAAVFKNVVIPVIKVAAIVLDGFVSTLKIAGKGIGALAAAVAALANGDLAGAKQVFKEYKDDVAKVAEEHTKFQEKLALSGHEAVKLTDKVDKAKTVIKAHGKATKETKDELAEYVKKLQEVNQAFGQDEGVKARIELQDKYNESIKKGTSKARADALLAEGEAQIKLNKALRDGKEAQEAYVKAQGEVTQLEDAVKLQEFELTLIGKSKDERAAAIAKFKEEAELRKIVNGLTEEAAGKISEEVRALQKRQEAALKAKADDDRLQALTKDTMVEKNKAALDDVAFLYQAYTAGKIKSEEEYVQAVILVLDKLKDKNKEVATESQVFWMEAAKGIQNSLSTFFFDIMQGKLDNLGVSIKKVFDQLIANALAAKAATALFGADFGKTGNVGSGSIADVAGSYLSGLFGGFRAVGGDVLPGRSYIVGDSVSNPRGERFVPKEPGTILPAGSNENAGGSVAIHISALDGADVMKVLNSRAREITQLVSSTRGKLNIRGA